MLYVTSEHWKRIGTCGYVSGQLKFFERRWYLEIIDFQSDKYLTLVVPVKTNVSPIPSSIHMRRGKFDGKDMEIKILAKR